MTTAPGGQPAGRLLSPLASPIDRHACRIVMPAAQERLPLGLPACNALGLALRRRVRLGVPFALRRPVNRCPACLTADREAQEKPMSATFETVAGIISETCDIPREKITAESHAIEDLGIDSLAFLDIAFAIDKAFGIKLPLEQWTQEVNEGKAPAEQYFVLKNLCDRIDGLVAAKSA
jgi:acyl carrier protein